MKHAYWLKILLLMLVITNVGYAQIILQSHRQNDSVGQIPAGGSINEEFTLTCIITEGQNDRCVGNLYFDLDTLGNQVAIANINSKTTSCQTNGHNHASCQINLANQESFRTIFTLSATRSARGTTQLVVSANGTGSMPTQSYPYEIITGFIDVHQIPDPSIAIADWYPIAYNTALVISNAGPATALGVHLTQIFPQNMEVKFAPTEGCRLDEDPNILTCDFASMNPGIITIPYVLSPKFATLEGYYPTHINLTSDLNNIDKKSSILVLSVNKFFGINNLPITANTNTTISDKIKFISMNPDLVRNKNVNSAGIIWTATFDDGLKVIEVKPEDDGMSCSTNTQDNSVTCKTLDEKAANAEIKLTVLNRATPGMEGVTLKWVGEVSGSTISQVWVKHSLTQNSSTLD